MQGISQPGGGQKYSLLLRHGNEGKGIEAKQAKFIRRRGKKGVFASVSAWVAVLPTQPARPC